MHQISTLLGLLLVGAVFGQEQNKNICKNPLVVQRRMADDVRYASPFYVVGLPRTPKTEQIDNVCYTYFESDNGPFFHIISVVYQNGTNSYHKLTKQDITDRNGLAEAKAESSSCIYHDYTLTPICNVSVFILYRCFIQGTCDDLDIGASPEVDARVALAASTELSDVCRSETEQSLKDTSTLNGGDYVILPQKLKPQCITKYGNRTSLNPKNALGHREIDEIEVVGDNRLDDGESGSGAILPATTQAAEDSLGLLPKFGGSNSEEESNKPLLSAFPSSNASKSDSETSSQSKFAHKKPLPSGSGMTTSKKTYAHAVKSNPTYKIVKKVVEGVERDVIESWRRPEVPKCSCS